MCVYCVYVCVYLWIIILRKERFHGKKKITNCINEYICLIITCIIPWNNSVVFYCL